jgi:radical SAM protein with 4Fe4S-binding SPASM domain
MLELIEFTVTSRCNARCRMCHMWQRKDPDIPLAKVREILGSRMIKDSVVNLVLTGGEPTLREDLPEIFDLAFKNLTKLKYATFFTNSLVPSRAQDAVLRIMDYKEQSRRKDVAVTVSLSLDGIGKVHDNVRGIDGAFGRVMENYLGLKALAGRQDFTVNFNFTVQKENVANGGALAMLEAAEGALLPMTFTLVYGKDVFLNRVNDDEWAVKDGSYRNEVIRFYEAVVRKADSGGLIIDNGEYYPQVLSQLKGKPRTMPCLYREKKACLIDADGSVYLCEVTKDSLAGNIYHNSFDEIWDSAQKDEAYSMMIRHCANCFSSCLGSGRYQLLDIWQSGGVSGIAKLSLSELRKRKNRLTRLIREYGYAIIPRL